MSHQVVWTKLIVETFMEEMMQRVSGKERSTLEEAMAILRR